MAFALFPHLPVELRLYIWNCSFSPRNVGIKVRFRDGRFSDWVTRKSTPSPPIALQVCHESREEALKCYILSFGTSVHLPRIYFNYQIDILCFGDGPDALRLFPDRETQYEMGASDYLLNLWHGRSFQSRLQNEAKVIAAEKVKYLTLDVDDSIYDRPCFCWQEIRLFDGLKDLLLVTWDPADRAEELMAYFRATMNAMAKAHPEWVVPKTKVVSALSGKEWGPLTPEQSDESS